jgi:transcriptional regulator with XRE-family HTH domain
MPVRGHFDAVGFFSALDAEREARRLTWKQVAGQAGVSASTLTRMGQGRRPDVDSLAALTSWSGLDPGRFVRAGDAKSEPEPLAMISTYLRSDPNLTDEGAAALDELIKATYDRIRKRDVVATRLQDRSE